MPPTPNLAAVRDTVAALQPELRDLARRLVAAASLPDHEHDAQAVLVAALQGQGLDVVRQPVRYADVRHHRAFGDDGFSPDGRVNVVARWPGGDEDAGRSLVLNGHVDVVPTGDPGRWTRPPFAATVEGSRLYGRGACDMKGGLVAAVGALRALRELGVQPVGSVTLQSVVGEETGGVGTLAALVAGYTADAALILEPTSLRACPVQSGATTFRLVVDGRATHGATAGEGVSALDRFAGLLPALHTLGTERQREVPAELTDLYPDADGVAPLSVGTVRCGDWHSTVPDRLVAEGRLGVLPREPVAAARAALEEAVRGAAATDPWLEQHPPTVEWFEAPFESGETPLDAPFLHTLRQVHAAHLGGAPELRGVPYGSDLRLFTNHAGMDAVLYGPGDVRLAHAVDEWVDLDEVQVATEVVAGVILAWCGT